MLQGCSFPCVSCEESFWSCSRMWTEVRLRRSVFSSPPQLTEANVAVRFCIKGLCGRNNGDVSWCGTWAFEPSLVFHRDLGKIRRCFPQTASLNVDFLKIRERLFFLSVITKACHRPRRDYSLIAAPVNMMRDCSVWYIRQGVRETTISFNFHALALGWITSGSERGASRASSLSEAPTCRTSENVLVQTELDRVWFRSQCVPIIVGL